MWNYIFPLDVYDDDIFSVLENNEYEFLGSVTEEVKECKIELDIVKNTSCSLDIFPGCDLYECDDEMSYFTKDTIISDDKAYIFTNGVVFIKYYEKSKCAKIFVEK